MSAGTQQARVAGQQTVDGTWPLPVLFLPRLVFTLSLCLSLHILSLLSSGVVGGSGEEMKENRTMEGHVSFLPLPEVFFTNYDSSGCTVNIQTGGDSTKLFTLLFFCTNTVMERKARGERKGINLVHAIKTAPQGKQSHLYISSSFKKRFYCIYLTLKCKRHLLLQRCITSHRDPKPRSQHTT